MTTPRLTAPGQSKIQNPESSIAGRPRSVWSARSASGISAPTWNLEPGTWNASRRKPRRGVVLLLVVSLLALFLLLGATFSLVAIHALHGSKLELKVQQSGDQPEVEMDLVMGQILYDTQARTALWSQSLLADLYGIDGIGGEVANASTPPATNNNQFMRIEARLATSPADQPYQTTYVSFSPVPDYYVGRILTFRSGVFTNISSRITRYEPPQPTALPPTPPVFYVEMPKTNGTTLTPPAVNDKFVINGAPFNGTGLGYDRGASTYNLNAPQPSPWNVTTESSTPEYMALLPHLSASPQTGLNPIYSAARGGMDESYDAADYQNIYLAMVPPGVTRTRTLPILPSFHRPELVNYWLGKIDSTQKDILTGLPYLYSSPAVQSFFRQFIFRPMPWDHPNFTGSNPNFPAGLASLQQVINSLRSQDASGNIIHPWDVDNDGDTIPDSIWIDPGLPIITMPDGRRVKRLAAILVKDLDGRLNVNAHGNSQQWYEDPSIPTGNKDVHRAAFAIPPGTPTNDWKAGGSTANFYLSRGLGTGPAEVDFQHIFGTAANAKTAYQNLITARYSRGTESKPGISGNDYYSAFRWMGLPQFQTDVPGASVFAKEWASPPDVWGRGAMGLDQFGQPYWLFSGQYYYNPADPDSTQGENNDNPYEFQYDYTRATADQPYLPREMERLLRYHDPDSLSVQSRLIDTTLGYLGSFAAGERPGELGDSHLRRELLTVLGSHIPVPPGLLASHLRTTFQTGPATASEPAGAGYNSILDLYYQALQGTGTGFSTAWASIVPFEFRHGELFNLNRPIGNGVDDNNNYVADEPLENDTANPNLIFVGGPKMEAVNDSPTAAPIDPRQEYARHLYCLMMMLKDPTWQVQKDVDGSGAIDANDTPRLIAQWAVNVIDFRDSDCIMTRFDYDPTPFDSNGWSPTGTTFVWGVERPELLITETLAFHDRRTEDLDNEQPDPATDEAEFTADHPSNPTMPDADYDQRLVPQASCFIELYNPWFDAANGQFPANGQIQRRPAELYATVNNMSGVNLDRTTPDALRTPVWRMLVIRGGTHESFSDPAFNPDAARINDALLDEPTDIERAVYFTNPSTSPGVPAAPCVTFYSSGGNPDVTASTLSLLAPGQYAVIGSSGSRVGTTYTTHVGNVQGDTDLTAPVNPDTRKLVLQPGQQRTAGTIAVSEFRVEDNSAPNAVDQTIAARQAIAVPIDLPRSFNITDPPNATGYPLPPAPPGSERESFYQPPRDIPLDAELDAEDAAAGSLFQRQKDGTFGNFRTVLLQRLADPTRPYDVNLNPYITIDRSSTDVTAFNGITNDTNAPGNTSPEPINFQTFQRGGSHAVAGTWDGSGALDADRKLWPMTPPRDLDYAPSASPLEPAAFVTPHYFPYQLYHTLGYVNSRYGAPVLVGPYSGAPTPTAGQTAAFPWLTFNNRPFANAMELLLVPATNQYGLLFNYSLKTAASTGNEYESSITNVPFTHLLNFFQSRETTPPPMTGPHFSRLLDFVHVPSPFVQADLYYNSQHFSTTATASNPSDDTAADTFRPPFHKLSRFREPGRTNINTVFDDATTTGNPATNLPSNPIVQALFKGTPNMDPAMDSYTTGLGSTFVNNLRLSRQSYPGTGPYTMDSGNTPTMFGNPFRAQDASDLFPGAPAAAPPPVTAGFLRPQTAGIPSNPVWPPLFALEMTSPVPAGSEHEDSTRNPYFRYQPLQRAGNLLSTQSNCFAIWITIGYFEVEENRNAVGQLVFDPGHLDGYRLGQEIGLDTGELVRHRGFYIVDRSIPVGFMPGSRLNTDDCILVRRLIE